MSEYDLINSQKNSVITVITFLEKIRKQVPEFWDFCFLGDRSFMTPRYSVS